MAASRINGITIKIDGDTTKLSDALRDVDKKISETSAGLKDVEKLLKLDPSNTELLSQKQKLLSDNVKQVNEKLLKEQDALKQLETAGNSDKTVKQQDALKREIIATSQQLETAKNKQEALKREIIATSQQLETAKNKQEALNSSMNNSGVSKVKDSLNQLGTGLSNVNEKLSPVIDKIGTGLKTACAVGAAAAAAAAAGISAMVKSAASAADDINTMSKVTGLSTEEIQKYNFAADVMDVSTDTIASSMKKLTKNMDTARSGTGDAADAFKTLGVSVTNSDGSLRSSNDVFNDALDALSKVGNETERDALSMSLFGKSATDLNPLIEGGSETLKKLGDSAESAGLILSQDMLDTLNDTQDQFDIFSSNCKSAGMVLSATLAPAFTEAMESVNGFVTGFVKAFSEDGIGGAIDYVGTTVENIINTAAKFIEDNKDIIRTKVTEIVSGISVWITENLPMILTAAMDLIMAFASGLIDALPEVITAVMTIMNTFIEYIIENLPQIIEAAVQIMLALVSGLIQELPVLISYIPQIILAIVNGLRSAFSLLLDVGARIIGEIRTGISSGVGGLITNVMSIGENIVKGVWQGIQNMASWFSQKVYDFFGGIVNGVKDFLGIASPSKVFAEIGDYMGQGLQEGWAKSIKNFAPSADISARMTSLAGVGGNTTNKTMNQNLYFGETYHKRDGVGIADSINRELGMAVN